MGTAVALANDSWRRVACMLLSLLQFGALFVENRQVHLSCFSCLSSREHRHKTNLQLTRPSRPIVPIFYASVMEMAANHVWSLIRACIQHHETCLCPQRQSCLCHQR